MFYVVKNYAKRASVSLSLTERRWLRVMGALNQYQARLFVAEKALELGRGGITRLSRLTGMSRVTITNGIAELSGGRRLREPEAGRVRAPGGGRKKVEAADRGMQGQLKAVVEETTAGDPMSPLKWTSKSTRGIAEELTRGGHPVSNVTVARCSGRDGIHPAKQGEDARGSTASRPGRSVPLPESSGEGFPTVGRSCDFGRYEEEGTRWSL